MFSVVCDFLSKGEYGGGGVGGLKGALSPVQKYLNVPRLGFS